MDLNVLINRCYDQAKAKGWTEKPISVPEMIALLHSEVSEALESYRNGEPLYWEDKDGKPQGMFTEFADVFIRMGHYIVTLDEHHDFETIVARKLGYNMTREHRHGGKLI